MSKNTRNILAGLVCMVISFLLTVASGSVNSGVQMWCAVFAYLIGMVGFGVTGHGLVCFLSIE